MDNSPNMQDVITTLHSQVTELSAANVALTEQLSDLRCEAAILRHRDERSRQVLDSLPTLVSLFRADGSVDVINRGILDFTGKTHEELVGWAMSNLVHPDHLSSAVQASKNGIASGARYDIVFQMRRHDGVYLWFEAVHLPLRNGAGEITHWCASITDIDDRKRSEDILRKREQESREIIDNIDSLVSLLAPNGDTQHINRRTLDYTGKTRDELEEWRTSNLIHEDDLAATTATFSDGLASGKRFPIVYRMRRHDGIYRWFEAHQTPVMDDDGNVVRWCVAVNDIDDRKRLEDALRESARISQSIIDGIPGLVATLEREGQVQTFNRQIFEYTGCPIEQIRQWGTNGIVHPDDMPRVAEIFTKSIAAGVPYLIEQRLRRFDGAYRWFDNRGVPIRDESGNVSGWYVLLADIDDRRRAEQALRESERQQRLIVNTIPALVVLFTPEGETEDANQQTLAYVGQSFAEFKGWATNGTAHPDDLANSTAVFTRCLESGQAYDFETRLRRFDGVYRWFKIRGNPVRDAEGRIRRWYGLLTDIDDLKRAEGALLESEREARLIVDSIPGLIAVFSPSGDLESVNQGLRQYYGRSLDELKCWQSNGLTHPDDLARVTEVFSKSMVSGEAFMIETRTRRSDGSYRWLQSRGLPLRDTTGRIVHWYNLLVDIDDRKRAENAVAASERKLQVAVDTTPVLLFEAKPDGSADFVNQQYAQYVGMPRENLLGWEWTTALHPDDVEMLLARWQTILASRRAGIAEARLRRHDGEYRWFLFWANPLCDEDGTILKWYCANTDIEDRKRAEQALAASERNLQLAIDTIPALAWSTTPDGAADFFNQGYQDYVGLSIEHLEGSRWVALLHPDDLPGMFGAWSAMLQSGQGGEHEARLRRHDGEYRWLLFRTNPLRDESGAIARWYGINTDIEDRKCAEDAQRRSKALLLHGEAVSETGSFFWRLDTGDILWSVELYRIFEFEPGSLVTMERIGSRVHPEDLPAMHDMTNRAHAGQSSEYQHRLAMPDGSVKYLNFVARTANDEDGRPAYMGAVQDVTQSYLSKVALDKLRSELAYMARVTSLGALTASIAHEVNQPLSGIVTNASTCVRMLSADPPNIAGALETARRTIRDANRASEVITGLRGMFGKRDAATFEEVALNDAVRDVVALSRVELQQGGATLRWELAEDLPPIAGDRVQIQQVILNLLLNASDALSSVKDGPRQITIHTDHDGQESVRLTVRDTGIGIDPTIAPRLFDAFFTTKEAGMGIGLSVCRSIVERHQGRIWASANDGPGASFSFVLPRNAAQSAAGAPSADPHRGA